MIEFPENFFVGEEREGFFIEEMMKRAWAAQMKVLDEIGRVCKKYGLTYFADCGTLLGAVRHHGFIPWDDDIDISMKPRDYRRFLQVAPAELPESYQVLSLFTHDEYDEIFARVVNSNKVNAKTEWLKEWYGCPFVCGVDIFPLNYMPTSAEELSIQKNLYRVVRSAWASCENQTDETEKLLKSVEELCGVQLNRADGLKKQLARLMEGIRTMYDEDEKGELTKLHTSLKKERWHVPQETYARAVPMSFEGMEILVPIGWDAVLRAQYGEDYMTPKRATSAHNYPFYNKQIKALQEKGYFL